MIGNDLLLWLAVAVGVVALWLISSYNRFVAQRTTIDAAWAGIEAELQRRHDLIPNLVETVAGYATHETTTLQLVTEARARAVTATAQHTGVADQAQAEDALTDGLSQLLALNERYPQLQADASFRDLQRQLVETEDRIAASRRLYNIEVAAYERRRGSVPSNLVANVFALEPRRPFEIVDAAARHARQVAL